ncbi:MAG: MFS transporter [Actinobacteria bacterium]|nr:MFS transporter [Actinomycetota bacterium]
MLAPTFILAGVAYMLRMVVQRAGMPLRQSYVVAMADPQERSSVAALSNVPSQVAMGLSPLAAGYLIDEVSLSLPFEIAGVFQLLNGAMYWYFFRNMPPVEETEVVVALGADEQSGAA